MSSSIIITKASGEKVFYESKKLQLSLEKAGADPGIIQRIIRQIEADLQPESTTQQIYQKAFRLLKKYSRPSAAKYKLKRAVMELGPSGYPFEHFVGEIMKDMGYFVKVGQVLQGKCVTHEVDVLAERDNHRIAIECKFGNKPGRKVDVKVSLYIHSRFRDLVNSWKNDPLHKDKTYEGWIVTNADMTSDAIQYGTCAGLHLVSWTYPAKGNLKDMIDNCHLYPVTTLTSLSKKEKNLLLESGIILCRELVGRASLLEKIHVPSPRIKKAMYEIEYLCSDH